jgi:hypothetical protein
VADSVVGAALHWHMHRAPDLEGAHHQLSDPAQIERLLEVTEGAWQFQHPTASPLETSVVFAREMNYNNHLR